jgi:hypothetical protein
MMSVNQLPKPILAKCLLFLLIMTSGCGQLLPMDIQPAGQQEGSREPALNGSTLLPQAEQPVTATPLPTQTPMRPIYIVDSSFSQPQQERLSSIFMVDPDGLRIVWTIATRYMPEAVLSLDGKRLFVADSYWTQVTRGDQRDVLSVYDARSGELFIDDIPIQGRLLYKGMPSADHPYLFLSGDGRQLFVGKYGDPDIHQFRLAVFDTNTLQPLHEGNWPSCERRITDSYDRHACESLSSLDPLRHLPWGKIEIPAGWRVSGDGALSPDGKWLYVGYDTRFPERDIFTDTIVVYDTTTWERLATVPLPSPITQFALSAAGDQLYVISPFTRSLAIYNTDTFQELTVMEDLGGFPALILVPETTR